MPATLIILGVLSTGAAILVFFVSILVGCDEADAAKKFEAVAMVFFVVGLALVAGGIASAISNRGRRASEREGD